MLPEERLAELGITLPPPPSAVGAYDPWVRTGNLILTSGQIPWLDTVAGRRTRLYWKAGR